MYDDGGAYITYIQPFKQEPGAVVYYYVPLRTDLFPGEQERDLTFWLGIDGEPK